MNEGKEKLVFVRGRVPASIKARFKATCAIKGRSMDEVMGELLRNWLEKNDSLENTKS